MFDERSRVNRALRGQAGLPSDACAAEVVAMMPDPSAVLRRVRKRLGRCYELAFQMVFENADDMGLLLVHGRACFITDIREALPHAWVVWGDRVYDPVLDIWMPEAAHEHDHDAVAEAVYSKMQAVRLLTLTRCYGPWRPDEEKVAEAPKPRP
jgi:hypothetical protein